MVRKWSTGPISLSYTTPRSSLMVRKWSTVPISLSYTTPRSRCTSSHYGGISPSILQGGGGRHRQRGGAAAGVSSRAAGGDAARRHAAPAGGRGARRGGGGGGGAAQAHPGGPRRPPAGGGACLTTLHPRSAPTRAWIGLGRVFSAKDPLLALGKVARTRRTRLSRGCASGSRSSKFGIY
jgi:hypothetical protein